jgi:7-cyano-7-deazaguanine synthase in queuosine biosynthesis
MGGLPVTLLIFHHDLSLLPPASENALPVQMYGLSGRGRGDVAVIGNQVTEKVKRLGVRIPAQVMDFLTIALAVTAADTFVRRSDSADGWARDISIRLPLYDPDRWQPLKRELQSALHFLSGDIWEFNFQNGGYPPPFPYRRRDRFHLVKLRNLDCACLFSGGLDSAIGAIDLLEQGRAPLLVSHAYKGDKSRQEEIAQFFSGRHSRFAVNTNPVSVDGKTDITMRTRSFNFLALGAVGAFAVKAVSQQKSVELIVPENGFISLNAPLTSRRIGSLSTRTTHPHFIACIQKLFDEAEIPCRISNPYQFKTKGEMAVECRNRQLLANIIDITVSCSHWKRKNQQCGVCVPCIIRRAALHISNFNEASEYTFNNLKDVLGETNRRDDLLAISIAIAQKSNRNLGSWIADSGPLLPSEFTAFQEVFLNGLNEIESLLQAEGIA